MKNLVLFLTLFFCTLSAHTQVIVTAAGGGSGGDGGPGLHAFIGTPYGIAVDDSGNLYICGQGGLRIRKVSPGYGGIISTVAGDGTPGYSGDGGLGILAKIGGVVDLAVDHYGNVYFADANNHVVRKVSPSDTISTIAGTHVAGYSGDGMHADSAQLKSPSSVAIDNLGNLYVTDNANYRIRKIDTAHIITTVAGTGVSGFTPDGARADTAKIRMPEIVRTDRRGNIYFRDSNIIRRIDANGIITTIAGNGITGYNGDGIPATSAAIDVWSFGLDTSGNLYIADAFNFRVRKVTGGIISTIAGSGIGGYSGDYGPPLLARLSDVAGVAVNNKNEIFISDEYNGVIRLVTDQPLIVPDNIASQSQLAIFPNPCHTFFTLQVNEPLTQEVCLVITDMMGRVLHREQAKSNSALRLVVAWPPGIYIVTATTRHTHSVGRVVVQ